MTDDAVTDAAPGSGIRHVNQRDCAACGERFYPSRDDAKWCSRACRQWAYRKRKKEEA
ncbi:MAG TPA: hypothetical protein VKY86_01610 [Promicromonospora sp.]|nr:hypothetical protein [Promicromonospora sp.]